MVACGETVLRNNTRQHHIFQVFISVYFLFVFIFNCDVYFLIWVWLSVHPLLYSVYERALVSLGAREIGIGLGGARICETPSAFASRKNDFRPLFLELEPLHRNIKCYYFGPMNCVWGQFIISCACVHARGNLVSVRRRRTKLNHKGLCAARALTRANAISCRQHVNWWYKSRLGFFHNCIITRHKADCRLFWTCCMTSLCLRIHVNFEQILFITQTLWTCQANFVNDIIPFSPLLELQPMCALTNVN